MKFCSGRTLSARYRIFSEELRKNFRQLRLQLDAKAGRIGQAHPALRHRLVISKTTEGLKDAGVRLIATQAQSGRSSLRLA